MGKSILNRNNCDLQLISIAIDLVNRVIAIQDCLPEIANNVHVSKATELAHKWNETFLNNYISTMEGGK